MSNFEKLPVELYGVVKDTDPLDAEGVWTTADNIRFNNTAAHKAGGETLGDTTDFQAYHLQFNGNHTSPLWIYMGDGVVRATDFSTETDLDGNLLVSSSAVNWDSSLFNNFPIMNNGIDAPFYWNNLLATPLAVLPGFPASTICKAIRPYRGFLVAMNITVGAVEDPNRIIWSDLSDAGAVPATWNIADPSTLGGDAYMTQNKAEIIDGLALRDFFVIYKTHSMVLMRLVRGQEVMSFTVPQINSGLLAKNCVQEFNGKHFVVSDADVVIFDGQSIQSIADQRVRAEIFDNIDTDNYRNSYVTRYDRQDEMWFCYPTTGQERPNKAAIWNWKDNTWTFRTLSNSYHIASGLANFAVSPTYNQATYTYDSASAAVPYNPIANNPTTDILVSATDLKLGLFDEGFDVYGVAMPSLLEKVSMTLGEEDRIKFVKSVTPQIKANPGTQIHIRIGTQMNPDDDISWQLEQAYVVGTTREVHTTASGRYISIRFRTDAEGDNFSLHGFYFTVALTGKH